MHMYIYNIVECEVVMFTRMCMDVCISACCLFDSLYEHINALILYKDLFE